MSQAPGRATITDVAKAAGVSKALVSFALNNRPGVSDETRARVLGVAEELGWRPSLRAKSLANSRAYAIGIVLARPAEVIASDPFFPSFIAGVERALSLHGMSLVLHVVEDEDSEVRGYTKLASEGRVDGVILMDLRQDDPRISLLRGLGLPTVTLNRPDVDSPFPAVCVDDSEPVRQLVARLVELGHGRIAHVAGPQHLLHARSREQAWRDSVTGAGLSDEWLVESDFSAAGGAAATRALLARPVPPTAIVYANDVMAAAGVAVAQSAGLSLPGELSIVGFDDMELAQYLNPPLSTVATDAFGWGRHAADVLHRLIDGDEEVGDVILAPSRVVLRGSVAAAPGLP